ncbi:MAG: hypothetical protein JWS12_155 [Candidatus Saccharibacteria bacterium]|nr:hypothetical protein [Candidatus Saccharibacteria bacterium]
MKIHRFYAPHIELKHDFWLHDPGLLQQWRKVLRFKAGEQLVLFDGQQDRLYKLLELKDAEAHLVLITEYARKLPAKNIYLFWALLKKDKNDWVVQKCTELGVSHFVPILADRSEKTGFNEQRATKIAIEAAEQCGRSDIPSVREPINLTTAFNEFATKLQLLVCEQSSDNQKLEITDTVGVFIGPEGGWSEAEKTLFDAHNTQHLNLHDFTLRAETACVTAIGKLV